MIPRVDAQEVKRTEEFLPGGDVRIKGNLWIRAAFRDSGLKRVPREKTLRMALERVVKKCKLRHGLSLCRLKALFPVPFILPYAHTLTAQELCAHLRLWERPASAPSVDSRTGPLGRDQISNFLKRTAFMFWLIFFLLASPRLPWS